ncbi:hypothetical protein [Streptomyces longisporoflavus]|uniref:Uncharacterized protein n=1 Tax=Streptomyces longisporoflavus TaxID=28044 RepID=A0ABW7R337_9ACTN
MPTPSDRPRLVGAAEIGEEFGVSTGTARRLYRDRLQGTEPLFPEPVSSRGREKLFDHRAVTDWFAIHRGPQVKNRLQEAGVSLRSGDPDELLNATQVARILGYKNSSQILKYLEDHPGYFPEPDQIEELGSPGRPWRRLLWRRATVAEWAANRPGKGRRGGSTREARPLPAVSSDGDPDELLTVAEAAALLGYKSASSFSSSLAQGNLPLLEEIDGTKPSTRGPAKRAWTRRRLKQQQAQRRRTD